MGAKYLRGRLAQVESGVITKAPSSIQPVLLLGTLRILTLSKLREAIFYKIIEVVLFFLFFLFLCVILVVPFSIKTPKIILWTCPITLCVFGETVSIRSMNHHQSVD